MEQTKHLEQEDQVRTDLEEKVRLVDTQIFELEERHKVQSDGVEQIAKKVARYCITIVEACFVCIFMTQ